MPTPTEIAQAFSGHRFAEAYPHLDPDVRWENVNGPLLLGRDAVIAACEETLGHLGSVTTTFHHVTTVTGTDRVVIDVTAEYADADGQGTVVASCDLYAFTDELITAIRSYTVEVPGERGRDTSADHGDQVDG